MKEIYSSLAGKVLRKEVLLFFKFPLTKVMESKSLFYLFIIIFFCKLIFSVCSNLKIAFISVTILVKKPIERLRNISPLPFRRISSYLRRALASLCCAYERLWNTPKRQNSGINNFKYKRACHACSLYIQAILNGRVIKIKRNAKQCINIDITL